MSKVKLSSVAKGSVVRLNDGRVVSVRRNQKLKNADGKLAYYAMIRVSDENGAVTMRSVTSSTSPSASTATTSPRLA